MTSANPPTPGTAVAHGRPRFDVSGASDVGRQRSENQDHFLIADLRRQLTIRESDIPHEDCHELYGSRTGLLMVVADGMGGHRDGERASSTAVQSCARYVLDMMHWFLKLSAQHEDDFQDELARSLQVVQKSLWSGKSDDRGMGTTVTMAYVLWPRMYVVHAGDSRCYLLRDKELRQLTTDHTIAQQLLEANALSSEEAATSHWRHVLWNCVGGSENVVTAEVTKTMLRPSDIVLLCSDGLNGMLADDDIRKILQASSSTREAADRLVDAANEAGGKDNISVVVCGYQSDPANAAEGSDCFEVDLEDTEILPET